MNYKLIVTPILLFFTFSCETYEFGPSISFTSTKKRLERHEWKLEHYEENSSDKTAEYEICTLKFKGSSLSINFKGSASSAYTIQDIAQYTLEDDNYRIVLKGNNFSNDLFIKRLDQKHFWFFYTDKNTVRSYKMIP